MFYFRRKDLSGSLGMGAFICPFMCRFVRGLFPFEGARSQVFAEVRGSFKHAVDSAVSKPVIILTKVLGAFTSEFLGS